VPEPERLRVFIRFYRSPHALVLSEIGQRPGLAIVKGDCGPHGAVVSLHAGATARAWKPRVVFPAVN